MAMRRRIKVGVNLSAAKRKPKSEADDSLKDDSILVPISNAKEQEKQETTPKRELVTESQSDDAAFKCPPRVDFNRSNSNTTTNNDESNQSDINDGAHVMQMDLQRTASGFPMSPSKAQRQRIRPTPVFGQRRNSLVGQPPSPQYQISTSDDAAESHPASPHKRERHYSGSQNYAFPVSSSTTKPPSHGSNRIRTESTCSAFSDSHASTTSKSRKADDHNAQRTQTRRDFEARFPNGVPDKSNLKMFDLIYYNPITNPMEQKSKIDEIKKETRDETDKDADCLNNDKGALPVPQLKLNAKGELILDDKSLEIETTAEQEARKVLAKSSLIYLDENTGMNGFYKRQKRTRDWAPDETIRFYRCLQTIGTDFSMMCQLFPKRTRRDIKLKFKKEERCNGALINKALLHPNSFNIEVLKDQFDREDRQREEEEQRKQATKMQYKKVHIKTSKSARALKNADDIYNQELLELKVQKPKKKRKMKGSNKEETVETTTIENTKKKRQLKRSVENKSKIHRMDEQAAINLLVKDEQEFLAEERSNAELPNAKIPLQSDLEVQNNHESFHIPDETMPAENECIEFVTNDPLGYDPSQRFDYASDSEESRIENEFQVETYDTDSRTLVNMDSGNVTLVKDSQTMNATNMDEQNIRLIQNAEFVDSHFTPLPNMSIEDEQNSLFGLVDTDTDTDMRGGKCTPKTENVSLEEQKSTQETLPPNQLFETTAYPNTCSYKQFSPKTENTDTGEVEISSVTLPPALQSDQLEFLHADSPEQFNQKSETSCTRQPIQSPEAMNDEAEIQKILENIANGSLFVVSTINPTTPNENRNEIYMMDPKTGELGDEPLDLPQELIQSILSVMS